MSALVTFAPLNLETEASRSGIASWQHTQKRSDTRIGISPIIPYLVVIYDGHRSTYFDYSIGFV